MNLPDKRNAFWLILFFWVLVGFPPLLYGWRGIVSQGGLSLLYGSLSAALVCLIPVLLIPRYFRVICTSLGLALWTSSLIALAYFTIHGDPVTQSVVFAMFESNPEESMEFFSQYLSPVLIMGLSLYTACAWLIWKRLRPLEASRGFTCAMCGLILVFAYPARHVLDQTDVYKILNGFTQYRHRILQINELLTRGAPPLNHLVDVSGEMPRTLVLVIGESTTSRHMSLYGYPRQTSPLLMDLRSSDQNLVVFDDVIAPRPYTIEVLHQALTFANQEQPQRFPGEPTLLNLMKQAGYKIIWITNQQTMNRVGLLSVFPSQADELIALNQQFQKEANQTDEVVLSPFERALQDPTSKKMIVVHLLGAHLEYQSRYPAAFDIFKGREHTPPGLDAGQLAHYNAYDNAVRYNDSIISRLIESYRKSGANGFMLYFSDHGEEVFDTPPHQTLGRNEDAPTPGQYAIPFFLWLSPSWQADHPRDFSGMTQRRYSTTHLIHTWSDLAGLSYDNFQPELSIVNPDFKPFTRWIGSPDGKLKDYDMIFRLNESNKKVDK